MFCFSWCCCCCFLVGCLCFCFEFIRSDIFTYCYHHFVSIYSYWLLLTRKLHSFEHSDGIWYSMNSMNSMNIAKPWYVATPSHHWFFSSSLFRRIERKNVLDRIASSHSHFLFFVSLLSQWNVKHITLTKQAVSQPTSYFGENLSSASLVWRYTHYTVQNSIGLYIRIQLSDWIM